VRAGVRPTLLFAAFVFLRSDTQAAPAEAIQTLRIECGNLSVLLRDNSLSPGILSGLDSLFSKTDAPDFDAFDPDDRGASAGLNFEHIICGHSNQFNAFTPRRGRYELFKQPQDCSAMLVRKAEDEPWAMSSSLKYTVIAPSSIDFEFECRSHQKELFGSRGYAVLFFANYMNDVEDVAIHFRGVPGPGKAEQWIKAVRRLWDDKLYFEQLSAASVTYAARAEIDPEFQISSLLRLAEQAVAVASHEV